MFSYAFVDRIFVTLFPVPLSPSPPTGRDLGGRGGDEQRGLLPVGDGGEPGKNVRTHPMAWPRCSTPARYFQNLAPPPRLLSRGSGGTDITCSCSGCQNHYNHYTSVTLRRGRRGHAPKNRRFIKTGIRQLLWGAFTASVQCSETHSIRG